MCAGLKCVKIRLISKKNRRTKYQEFEQVPLFTGGVVSHCAEELEPLTPSRSTERLHREMQNLEGLMKDLSAITQQQFHC